MGSRQQLMRTLDAVHLGNLARRAKVAVETLQFTVMARTTWGWRPLVPEVPFTDCCRRAILTLKAVQPAYTFGDYLEFGVSRGTSLACMYKALQEAELPEVRLIGFDSFMGLPPEASAEHWKPGEFASTMGATRRYLTRSGVDLAKVQLVKGWFSDTLTEMTRTRLGISKASLIMVDCDIYSASREALKFSASLIRDHAVILFDDWGWRADRGEIGQQEAFAEFLEANPHLSAKALPAYLPEARCFLVTRAGSADGSERANATATNSAT